MPPDLQERLRAQLRRDPSDRDVSFLLSLCVREPFVVYSDERARLRRLLAGQGRSTRERLVAEVAEQLLARSATPSRGLRRPQSGTIDVVDVPPERARHAAGGESDIRTRDTDPAPPGDD